MAKQRYIQDRFWTDPFVQTLTVQDKLLFLYLLTNPLVALCGIYEITIDRMKFETGCIDPPRTLQKLEKSGKILYYNNYLYLVNFVKNQNVKSEDLMKGIEREQAKIPTHVMKYFREGLGTLPRGSTPPPSTLLKLTLPNINMDMSKDFEKMLAWFNKQNACELKKTPKKIQQYAARLKSFSAKEISEAIKNRSDNDFMKGGNPSNVEYRKSWDSLFRNDEQIEKWLNCKKVNPITLIQDV